MSFDPQDHLPLTPLWFQILVALGDGKQHGYGILKEIERRQGTQGRLPTGPVYLALQRLDERGFIRSAGSEATESGPRRRLYEITREGRGVAAAEAARLAAVLGAALDRRLVDRATFDRLVGGS